MNNLNSQELAEKLEKLAKKTTSKDHQWILKFCAMNIESGKAVDLKDYLSNCFVARNLIVASERN